MSIENTSGLIPLEFKVLVLPKQVEEKTAGGIVIPEDTRDKESQMAIEATFIEAGGNAFEDWKMLRCPVIGDRILIAKYAGSAIRGADGKEYRVLHDKDIAAIITADGVGRAV